MIANFPAAWKQLLGNEGGYSNDPADPGGETMYGITKRVAVANGYTGPMNALPAATAQAIGKKCYWDAYSCDQFPQSIAFQVLDAAYNGGHPAQWLQQAVGVVQDGNIGPATIAAVNAADPMNVVARFIAYRIQYMTGLREWATFGKGWANRMAADLIYGASV